jgi:tetratricopeptide (TPR) repeat protein
MNKHNDPKKNANAGEAGPAGQNEEIKPSDYLRAVRSHLRSGKHKDAYSLLLQASVRFPEDPLIISYYGCLQALVDKKYRSGVETCKRAILLLKKQGSFSEEVLYPVFYLNLGRAYVAADKKKDAIDAFSKGLRYDNGNSDLNKELQGLGVRKSPTVSFLDRSNPINVLLGMMLKSSKKAPPAKKSGGRGSSR